ncbi:HlyD family secretion protein [Primorskyibacter sp. S87]|uniref:HlyD family secretion protein n=1 Tax=Primorskyibacter sp. S87 TaxID=3415126 RepID=UPI003C7D9C85
MIIFLTLIYVALLFVLIKIKVLPNKPATWLSTIVWMVGLFLFLFIPMQWGAPSGSARLMTRAVQIVPNVSGQVVEIAAEPNVPMKAGDLLFRIDPEPFQIAVDLAKATLVRVKAQAEQDQDTLDDAIANLRKAEANEVLAQARYEDDLQLFEKEVISQNRLERRETELEAAQAATESARSSVSKAQIELGAVTEDGVVAKVAEAQAQLDQAVWNLEQTEVLAPSDGFATNLALTVGQRVTSLPLAPSGIFVDTSEEILLAEIQQIYLRHVKPGQLVEITLKMWPGKVFTGTVENRIDLASQGQALVTGTLAMGGSIGSEPFFVRIQTDEPLDFTKTPAGSVGSVAIYTESVATTHIIRKIMIRMEAILNYLNPVL